MPQLKTILKFIVHLFMISLCYFLAFIMKLFSSKYRNIVLVSERGNDARDNGYFFYKYLKEKHPLLQSYYVISSDSPDYQKVISLGNIIETNSFKHYLYYCLCKARISAHRWGGDLPNAYFFYKTRKFRNKFKKVISLKHGIFKDIQPSYKYGEYYPNTLIAGAKPEYDFLIANFGYPKGVVQYTGLARFDTLECPVLKNQILIMPTFRTWLQNAPTQEVKNSEYVKRWNALLKNERIHTILKANNMQLVFYPHHVMQPYISLFSSCFDNVTIASRKDFDVQSLLKESKLLITDFSSVFFDFAYMSKPLIYYQFDSDRFIKEHYDYTKGYFSYCRDGFGPVIDDEDKLINTIQDIIENNFAISKAVLDRQNTFFELRDKHNCDRIFDCLCGQIKLKRVD